MKKKGFLTFALLLVCLFCMPLFVACNGSGGTEVKGIRFVQDVYELDVLVPTKLEYKLYPSTAKSSDVKYSVKVPGVSSAALVCNVDNNGYCTIRTSDFPDDATVTISYGEYSDTCSVRLKKYPSTISFMDALGQNVITSQNVNIGAVVSLNLMGNIDGTLTPIDTSKYNLKISNSNQQKVGVSDTDGLVVYSTGQVGTAKLSVYVQDSKGNKVSNDAEITINIVGSVSHAIVMLQGQQQFLNPINNYTTDASEQKTVTYIASGATCDIKAYLFSKQNQDYVCLDTLKLEAMVDSPNIASIEADPLNNGSFKLIFNLDNITACAVVRVEITCDGVDEYGNPVKFIFYVAYHQAGCLDIHGNCTCPEGCPCA